MNTIIVDKATLIETLKDNRLKHSEIYEEASIQYRIKAKELYEKYLADIADPENPVPRGFPLAVPEEHLDDYDRVLSMMQWHTEATIELTQSEFQMYVQDEWGWHHSFASNSGSYTGRMA